MCRTLVGSITSRDLLPFLRYQVRPLSPVLLHLSHVTMHVINACMYVIIILYVITVCMYVSPGTRNCRSMSRVGIRCTAAQTHHGAVWYRRRRPSLCLLHLSHVTMHVINACMYVIIILYVITVCMYVSPRNADENVPQAIFMRCPKSHCVGGCRQPSSGCQSAVWSLMLKGRTAICTTDGLCISVLC